MPQCTATTAKGMRCKNTAPGRVCYKHSRPLCSQPLYSQPLFSQPGIVLAFCLLCVIVAFIGRVGGITEVAAVSVNEEDPSALPLDPRWS